MSAAPYWGQLPEPKSAHDIQRLAAGDALSSDNRHSMEAPMLPRRSRRNSVVTAMTDAYTDTTFSPHTPLTPNFGLAPRPLSIHRGPDAPKGLPRSDNHLSTMGHAAPGQDAREPPVSHQHSYSNGHGPHLNPPGPPNARPRPQPIYQDPRGDLGFGYQVDYAPKRDAPSDAYQRPIHDVQSPRDAPTAAVEAAGQREPPIAMRQSERRRKLATERSPLQKLELTLDSMTKEEKRARVEAAEQRARQRAANKMDTSPTRPSQKTAPDERRRFADAMPDQQTSSATMLMPPAQSAIPPRAELPLQRQLMPSHRERIQQSYNDPVPPPRMMSEQASHRTDPTIATAPHRNLSFRERAATNEPPSVSSDSTRQRPLPNIEGYPPLHNTNVHKVRKEGPKDFEYRQHLLDIRSMSGPDAPPSTTSARTRPLAASQAENELRRTETNPPLEARGSNWDPDTQAPQGTQGMRRHVTEPIYSRKAIVDDGVNQAGGQASPLQRNQVREQRRASETADNRRQAALNEDAHESLEARERLERDGADTSGDELVNGSRGALRRPKDLRPGDGLYKPPEWLSEWTRATTGLLSGILLDMGDSPSATTFQGRCWRETSGQGSSGVYSPRSRRAEAFDREYSDSNAPTRFKPPLYLSCGPLLRYRGLRRERFPTRSPRGDTAVSEREIWRGSVMIVTKDSESSYEISPTMRLFVQEVKLLPPPPHQIKGETPPEYVDPIAGHPKLGRRGETLYVRPVEDLGEGRDHSLEEAGKGIFEAVKSVPDSQSADGESDYAGSFARRKKAIDVDGEKLQKFKDVRGFRLHVEHGFTFWRFNIEVELGDKQQRIAYRINRGPCMGFWVPARGEAMNIMFYSCNGFSASVKPDEYSGPDPMWRDVLNSHQSRPFHVMIGGGNQIYNDCVAYKSRLFDEWLEERDAQRKRDTPFSAAMQGELEAFYLERYCTWFSQGLFGLAVSQIPMVNMYDNHDVFDGYGSYPHHNMVSPVFCGLGAVAFKYYMLFQHQSLVTETEKSEPSWIMGLEPGPYIKELNHSIYVSLGGKVALLAVDCRTERSEFEVVREKTWEKIMNRMYAEIRRGQVEHLLLVLGTPIAYPRLVWLENILTSKLMAPVKALRRAGVLGKAINDIDGGVQVRDDLNEHWTAKNHKQERSLVIEDLQDLAIDKSLRITVLSGDVHMAAVGQFHSAPKLGLPKHNDPRYMPNVISSPMANAPCSHLMADLINKRSKVHHFDKQTVESMIPLFRHDVNGKSRNNAHLLPHRNWCSISLWTPGSTPPPTPPLSIYEDASSPPPPQTTTSSRNLIRRLSWRRKSAPRRIEAMHESIRGPRPPISGGLDILRNISRRLSSSDGQRPRKLIRTMSLGRSDSRDRGYLNYAYRNSESQPGEDGGGLDDHCDSDRYHDRLAHDEAPNLPRAAPRPSGLHGGGAHDDHGEDDDSCYSNSYPPRREQTMESLPGNGEHDVAVRRAFHRTPTGLSAKQMRQVERYQVDVEGGLEVVLNVEVSTTDPAGITVPYRLLVPRLQYEYNPSEDDIALKEHADENRLKRLFGLGRKQEKGRRYELEDERGDTDGGAYQSRESAG